MGRAPVVGVMHLVRDVDPVFARVELDATLSAFVAFLFWASVRIDTTGYGSGAWSRYDFVHAVDQHSRALRWTH